ncbi:MAG: HdeD family acid-resistance protein [Patescibacteria group bacterium]|nr:HdeD family acid-resistance protein [Patescibacteria group bacterium]
MCQASETRVGATVSDELNALREGWVWFLSLGIGLVVVSLIALGSAFWVTMGAIAVFGVLLIIAGIAQTVSAFWSPRWGGLLVHLLTGILYFVVGYIVVDNPMESAVALTLLIASFLIVMGVFRIVVALLERFHNWGWCLLSGCISGLLGVLILKQWPTSGEWVIGLFLGIEMLFNGMAWIMMADTLRRLPQPA